MIERYKMKCNNCNNLIPDDSEFCQYCGATLLNKCPACGADLPEDSAFCKKCGQKLSISVKIEQMSSGNTPSDSENADSSERTYKKAKKLMHGFKASNYEKAIELFSEIQEYKDAATLTDKCKEKIQELPKKRTARKKVIIITVAASIVIVSLSLLTILFIVPEAKYSTAQEKLDNKEFDEAVTLFEDLGQYKDSQDKILEAKYAKADNFFNNKDYDNAIQSFKSIGDYKDSWDRAKECTYQSMKSLQNKKEYFQAIKLGEPIKNYKDTSNLLDELHEDYAHEYYNNGDYDKAIIQYEKIKNCDLTSDFYLMCCYNDGKNLLKDSHYTEAINRFTYTAQYNYKDSNRQLQNAKYQYVKNWNEGNFHTVDEIRDNMMQDNKAYDYLVELMNDDYKDSETLYQKYYGTRFEVVVNTKEDDTETDMSRISVLSPIYFHLTMTSGKPNESLNINYKIQYPDNKYNIGDTEGGHFDFDWEVGSSGFNYWENGLSYDSYFWLDGYLTVTYYDENGNQVAKKSVYVYY